MKKTTKRTEREPVTILGSDASPAAEHLAGVLQIADTKAILAAALGEVSLLALAQREMASRGLGKNGLWVGFERAKKEWAVR